MYMIVQYDNSSDETLIFTWHGYWECNNQIVKNIKCSKYPGAVVSGNVSVVFVTSEVNFMNYKS